MINDRLLKKTKKKNIKKLTTKNQKMKVSKYLLLLLSFLSNHLFSQVGINTEEPNLNAALHVSERMKSTDPDANNRIKGIIIPRLTKTERDRLTYSDAPGNNTIRLNGSDNSLMIFNTTENCYNFWNNTSLEWKSICGDIGNADFSVDCTNIETNGNYVKGVQVDESNYVILKNVNVIKTGNYFIKATSSTNNGYSFAAQGVFTSLGIQTVKLFAQGTPSAAGTDAFTVKSSSNSIQNDCQFSVSVQAKTAKFTLNCSSVTVNGVYLKGVALTSGNTIVLNVKVTETGSYNITTESINGIRFYDSGIFSAVGNQSIILNGVGTPTVNSDFPITISSNAVVDNTTCSTNIPITLPAMKYAVIGANNDYSWHPNSIRAQAFNNSNFGPSGKVRIMSLSNAWNTNDPATAVTNLAGTNKPDILMYYSYGIIPTPVLVTALSDYVNAGGVLIFGSRDGYANEANALLNGIFGQGNAQAQIAGNGSIDDNVYPVNNLSDDPIINGPFGNAAGRYWGEDNASTGTVIVTSLPPNSVQIATATNQFSKYTVNPVYSTVWYNKSKNFVFFGDSVGASSTDTSEISYPALYINASPVTKRYGQWPNQSTQAQYIYNSILELNAISWGLEQAAVSGINTY